MTTNQITHLHWNAAGHFLEMRLRRLNEEVYGSDVSYTISILLALVLSGAVH